MLKERTLLKNYETLSSPFTENDEEHSSADEVSRSRGGEYTVEDAVESCGFGWFQVRIFLVCGLFSATDALEMLLLSVLSPELRCEWLLPEYKVALITTVSFLHFLVKE